MDMMLFLRWDLPWPREKAFQQGAAQNYISQGMSPASRLGGSLFSVKKTRCEVLLIYPELIFDPSRSPLR